MKAKYAVAVAAFCASSMYFAFAGDSPSIISDATPRIKELDRQVKLLVARVERLERQVAAAGLRTRFVIDHPFTGESSVDVQAHRRGVLRIPPSVDEGMMIDAIQHRMR